MSNLSVAGTAAVLPKVTFNLHGRHRGAQAGADQSLGGSVGQLPIGAAQNLFANVAQTLQQTLAAPTAAAAGAPAATGAPAALKAAGGKIDVSV